MTGSGSGVLIKDMQAKPLAQRSLLFMLAMAVSVAAWLSAFAFTLWNQRGDTLDNGLGTAQIHARNFNEHLTQILQMIELTTATLNVAEGPLEAEAIRERLMDILRPNPWLRAIALLDAEGRIVADTGHDGVGRNIDVSGFFPPIQEGDHLLRIGTPWMGRDFGDGEPTPVASDFDQQALYFVPLLRRLASRQDGLWLLVALNPDYFVNHAMQLLSPDEGHVQWLRYDGLLLASSHPYDQPGASHAAVAVGERLAQHDQDAFAQVLDDGRTLLTAYRTARRFPSVIAVHLDQQVILSVWVEQSRRLGAVVIPVLIVFVMVASLLWVRRQRHEARHLAASVFSSSSDAIVITSPGGIIRSLNPAFERLTGYGGVELIGRELCLVGGDPEECQRFKEVWPRFLDQQHWQGEMNCRRKDGQPIVVSLALDVVFDEVGKVTHCAGKMIDITERKLIEEKLQLAASVFSHSREGILITTLEGTIIDVNAAFAEITGFAREEVIGQNPRLLQSGLHDQAFYAEMWSSLLERDYWDGEIWNRRKSGEVFAEMLTISLVREPTGRPLRYVALFSDISTMKAYQQKLEMSAHYDILTELPNRLMLNDRLRQIMANALRRKTVFALAFIDLDGFKAVNDEFGHAMGDKLLIALSARMKDALRAGDTLARLGGDEFVALLIDLQDPLDCEPVLDRVGTAAARPTMIDGQRLVVSASIGVTFFPQPGVVEAEQLLAQADQAMYQAKLLGKNRREVYDLSAIEVEVAGPRRTPSKR